MNKLKLLCGLILLSASAWAQQNTLAGTTLAAAITPSQTQITLASTAAITSLVPSANSWSIYVDTEKMTVLFYGTNLAAKSLHVVRGSGTQAAAHISGAAVVVGPTNLFQGSDPPLGACTLAQVIVTPWINVKTGDQWLCGNAGFWVPGWNNDKRPYSPTATVASVAGSTLPSGPLFHMTGTNAITGFTLPVGFSYGQFCAIPDSGIWTWTAAGNIATAGTVTAANGVPVCFTWDQNLQKWFPSRVT